MKISALLAAFAIMSVVGVAEALTEGVSRRVTVAGEPAGTTIFVYFCNFRISGFEEYRCCYN